MKRDELRRNIALTLLSLLLTLGGLEGFARGFLRIQPITKRFQYDHRVGWVWTPGYDAIENFHGRNYRLRISSQGLRDGEIQIPKPENSFRILAVGDSVTEGPGIALEETFVKRLEHLMAEENPGRSVEVINAGTGDYGIEQEIIWLKQRGLAFEPDLVLLNLYLNDARGFSAPPPGMDQLLNFLSRESAFYTYYYNQFQEWLVEKETISTDFRFRYMGLIKSDSWKTDPAALTQLIGEADQDWGMLWQDEMLEDVQHRLVEMLDFTEARGIDLMVAIFPVNVQVYAKVNTPMNLEKPQEALVAFCRRNRIPTIDLLPALRAYSHEVLYFDQAHLTTRGHQIVAEQMARELHDNSVIAAR